MAYTLKEVREAKGLSVHQLAKVANISAQQIYNIESGKINSGQIRYETLKKLALALDRNIEEIF